MISLCQAFAIVVRQSSGDTCSTLIAEFFNGASGNGLRWQTQSAADILDNIAVGLMKDKTVHFLLLPACELQNVPDSRQLDF